MPYVKELIAYNKTNDEIIVNFTPIKVSEIVENDSLFPPKSTWITPSL